MDDQESEAAPEAGAPAWMATFADMSTLLLTFFVLLLSFASMDVVKFRDMMGSMQDAFGVQKQMAGNFAATGMAPEIRFAAAPDGLEDRQMLGEIEKVIKAQDLQEIVEAAATKRGVIVRIRGKLLFDAGSAKLRPASFPLLDEMAHLTEQFPFRVSIEGHTDDRPIHTAEFPSNWELSTARAIAALRYLVAEGGVEPVRLGSAGYADMRPVAPNDTPENRARNRRVEFVYYRDDEDEGPPLPAVTQTTSGGDAGGDDAPGQPTAAGPQVAPPAGTAATDSQPPGAPPAEPGGARTPVRAEEPGAAGGGHAG